MVGNTGFTQQIYGLGVRIEYKVNVIIVPNKKEQQKQQIMQFTVELQDCIPSVNASLTTRADPAGGQRGLQPIPPPPSFGKFSNLSDYPFLYQEQLYPLFYAHLTTDNLLTDCRYRGEKNISRFYCYIANDILKAESNLGLVTEWISRRCF